MTTLGTLVMLLGLICLAQGATMDVTIEVRSSVYNAMTEALPERPRSDGAGANRIVNQHLVQQQTVWMLGGGFTSVTGALLMVVGRLITNAKYQTREPVGM